ncbi:TonB-system energizer ExbB [Aliarcobacter skirrowii]|uniref:TonB-system energizer ExbB n=1 Tax=Aliarcobacter skirrowii TaxID=28200 RepID=UPI0009ED98C7|nr:TonB-system energizer ExbB [Aliarcobacter skirrowii]AZL54195.1 TonB-system energizer ExbB [Aliarcobacter skirrowii]RXJ76224.1 TonB-system energizer ExbB [Aliarcobacter skirrowii]
MFDDIEKLKHLVDYGVIGLLVVMSFVAVFFFIERVIFYKKIDVSSYKTKKSLDVALTKHLTIIGTIASNSPYIGLLGTVLAIMLTFMTMGGGGDIDAAKIMESLALALKATAVGLVVAIISMVLYNILSRFAEVLESDYETTEV